MTIGAWILVGTIAVLGVGFAIFGAEKDEAAKVLAVTIAICLAAVCGFRWWFGSTESGKRALKDQESNFSGGISRSVKIYDMEGDLIEQYSGKFDIEMSETHIVFDDEDGKRHIVYFTTGTVVIDEK